MWLWTKKPTHAWLCRKPLFCTCTLRLGTSCSPTHSPTEGTEAGGWRSLCASVPALLGGLLPAAPGCKCSFKQVGETPEEALSFSAAPLQQPRCSAACPQPETGAARAPLPSLSRASCWARPLAPRPDQPAPSPAGLRLGFPERGFPAVQAGCEPQHRHGQHREFPDSYRSRQVFAQACTSPHKPHLPGWAPCLSWAPFCAGRLGAAPLLQADERDGGREKPCPRRCLLSLPVS